jgi:hypothetical protein
MRIAASRVNKIAASLLFLLPFWAEAQLNNAFFTPHAPRQAFESEALFFHKNSEYFDPVAPGQTLLGAQVKALWNRDLGGQSALSGGLLFQGLYGAPANLQWLNLQSPIRLFPLLQLRYQRKYQRLYLGNTQGPFSHGLPEILMNYDWAWNRPVEYGIDYHLFSSKTLFNTWIDWRQASVAKESRQEIINAGIYVRQDISSLGQGTLSLPFHALVYHQGGENLVQRKPLVTQFNLSTGIQWKSPHWELQSLWVQSQDASPQLRQPYRDGWASCSWIQYRSESWEQALVFVRSHEFSAPLGAPLMSNVDRAQPYTTVRDRSMIQYRLHTTRYLPLEGTQLDARLEPMYDFRLKRFMVSAAAYVKVSF